jgi:phytoene dehydrogenase-like protein
VRNRRRSEWAGAAIVLAQAGLQVNVLEAESMPGGAARTQELTLPGFRHDFGSAVFPLGAGSPFFSSLPLIDHGLEWIHSPAPLAHPLDDGTTVMLERDLDETKNSLGIDGAADSTPTVRSFRWPSPVRSIADEHEPRRIASRS